MILKRVMKSISTDSKIPNARSGHKVTFNLNLLCIYHSIPWISAKLISSLSGPKQIFLRTSFESTRVWMIFGSENSFSFDFSSVFEKFSKFYLADWVKIENKLNFITVRVQFDENITIEHIYRTSALEFGWVMWRNWIECLIEIKLDLIQLCHTKWHRNDIELKSEYDTI